jgi:hypothetical protein
VFGRRAATDSTGGLSVWAGIGNFTSGLGISKTVLTVTVRVTGGDRMVTVNLQKH